MARKPHTSTYVDLVTRALAESESETAPKPRKTSKAPHWGMAVAGIAILATTVLFVRWMAHRVDAQMREEILVQAKIIAEAVDVKHVAALSGTEADVASPDYQSLKQQLSLVRRANPKCRFIYLMGRRSDGKIFFYVDSEDPDSPDYSPPGQVFDEADADDYAVFNTATGNARGGPYKDRWGVWISAEVPVFNPDTNRLLAVCGMDFNAESWKWDVATSTALPAAPAVPLFLLGLFMLASRLRGIAS